MDYQNRPGSKIGGGGVASDAQSNYDRRERLRKLALETIDLSKDPYFMKNHVGSFECKLCLTLHTNEGSYLAHTQGKKHQNNLGRRAAKEAREGGGTGVPMGKTGVSVRKIIKIGRPGFRATKVRDHLTGRVGVLFQIDYPEISADVVPRYRFMSSFEQQIEAPDRNFQYILFAAEPYETVAFKIQSLEVDKGKDFFSFWDADLKQFTFQFFFKNDSRM